MSHSLQLHLSESDGPPPIESLTQDLYSAIYTSLDDSVGRQTTPPRSDYGFWTPDMLKVVEHREYCYRKWRRTIGINKITWWIQHQEARAEVRRAISRRRNETWRAFCDKLASGEFTKATATMKRIRRGRTLHPTFTDPGGPLASANSMANHLETVYDGSLLPPRNPAQPVTPSTPSVPCLEESPFTDICVQNAIDRLPVRKAPGIDHIRGEMLKPLKDALAPVLSALFSLCWKWSVSPCEWRVAQVVPIYKKGSPTDPVNYRPISLTSVFRKILELCLQSLLSDASPQLDIAQGGFRPARGALDQALCLQELCAVHRKEHGAPPVLAFLDIKSAYDTVDRSVIWDALASSATPALLQMLQNLFDNVEIEILLSNATSHRFAPATGVLQGSILSPALYSIYINGLPSLLRSFRSTSMPINCLLYADDVALLGTWETLPHLLAICEQHSYTLGYRWSPSKCVVLHDDTHLPDTPRPRLSLYNTDLSRSPSFHYLGIPCRADGTINPAMLLQNNTSKALASMRIFNSIGVNPTGFSRLLAWRLYRQFIRPQMEYGLAITLFTVKQMRVLESAQDNCLRMIFGAHKTFSTLVIRHMAKLPSMTERVAILQAKFLWRSFTLPEDALLTSLLPELRADKRGQWSKLTQTRLWQQLPEPRDTIHKVAFRAAIRNFLDATFAACLLRPNTVLLRVCRPKLGLDPILWLPMSRRERSRCIRWRIGWLPGGKPQPCPCGTDHTSKRHLIVCLRMHSRLNIPRDSRADPLSYVLNQLPNLPPRSIPRCNYWTRTWQEVCQILLELDHRCHPDTELEHLTDPHPGQALLTWMNRPAPQQDPLLTTG